MTELIFSTFNLLVKGEYPELKFFNSLEAPIKKDKIYNIGDIYYKTSKYITNEKHCFISIHYGSKIPYTKEVLNIESNEDIENKNKETDISLLKRLFLYYSYSNRAIYISNAQNQNISFLKKYFSYYSKIEDIEVDSIVLNIEEFKETINSITEITLHSVADNLLSKEFNNNILPEGMYDQITGRKIKLIHKLQVPKLVELDYRRFIDWIWKSKEERHIDRFIIRGLDNENNTSIYKDGAFLHKETIETVEDDNKFPIEDELYNSLVSKVSK